MVGGALTMGLTMPGGMCMMGGEWLCGAAAAAANGLVGVDATCDVMCV